MENRALVFTKKKNQISKTFVQPFCHLENLLKEKKNLFSILRFN